MPPESPAIPSEEEWDPVFVHSRREAFLILATWLAALLWTVPYCYFNGYLPEKSVGDVEFILGMPSWVFWGIAVPWLIADVVAIWFCFGFFVDDDLDEASRQLEAQQETQTGADA